MRGQATHPHRGINTFLMLGLIGVLFLPQSRALAAMATPPQSTPPEDAPLVRWDQLRRTQYLQGGEVRWAQGLEQFDGQEIRLEGYLMPKFGAQDMTDMLLVALHPVSMFCGPTDMTALIEVYFPDFETDTWPDQPVEVWGVFERSQRPEDLQAIYRLRINGWREMNSWVQEFPGAGEVPQSERDSDP